MTHITIYPTEMNEHMVKLLAREMPAAISCVAAMEQVIKARVLVDDALAPRWVALQERGFGRVFLGGSLDPPTVDEVIQALRRDGDVLYGAWSDDPYQRLLPSNHSRREERSEFWQRDPNDAGERYVEIPEGCLSVPLLGRYLLSADTAERLVRWHGSLERAFEYAFGYSLTQNGLPVCECIAMVPVYGTVAVTVETAEPYRGRGYATYLAARTIREAERRGYNTYWNCAHDNVPGVRLAEKLGYRVRRTYLSTEWPRMGSPDAV